MRGRLGRRTKQLISCFSAKFFVFDVLVNTNMERPPTVIAQNMTYSRTPEKKQTGLRLDAGGQ